ASTVATTGNTCFPVAPLDGTVVVYPVDSMSYPREPPLAMVNPLKCGLLKLMVMCAESGTAVTVACSMYCESATQTISPVEKPEEVVEYAVGSPGAAVTTSTFTVPGA